MRISRTLLTVARILQSPVGDFDSSNKMIEKVKVHAFSEWVKVVLARSSGALVSLSPRKPWKSMRFLYSTTSTAELLRPLELLASRKISLARARLSCGKERIWSNSVLRFVRSTPRNPWHVNWLSTASDVL